VPFPRQDVVRSGYTLYLFVAQKQGATKRMPLLSLTREIVLKTRPPQIKKHKKRPVNSYKVKAVKGTKQHQYLYSFTLRNAIICKFYKN